MNKLPWYCAQLKKCVIKYLRAELITASQVQKRENLLGSTCYFWIRFSYKRCLQLPLIDKLAVFMKKEVVFS